MMQNVSQMPLFMFFVFKRVNEDLYISINEIYIYIKFKVIKL